MPSSFYVTGVGVLFTPQWYDMLLRLGQEEGVASDKVVEPVSVKLEMKYGSSHLTRAIHHNEERGSEQCVIAE